MDSYLIGNYNTSPYFYISKCKTLPDENKISLKIPKMFKK